MRNRVLTRQALELSGSARILRRQARRQCRNPLLPFRLPQNSFTHP